MFAFSFRNSIVSFPPFLDLFLLRLWRTLTFSFLFHRFTQLFARLFLDVLSHHSVFICLFTVLFSNNISCSSAAFHFSLISSRAWSSFVSSTSTPLSFHSFCIFVRYLSSKSLRYSLTHFFVTRNLNVECELRFSAIVCHTFPLSAVLALWQYGASNKTSRARASSWLFVHSITTPKEEKVEFQSNLWHHFYWNKSWRKMVSIKSSPFIFVTNNAKSFSRAVLTCRWLVSQDKNQG